LSVITSSQFVNNSKNWSTWIKKSETRVGVKSGDFVPKPGVIWLERLHEQNVLISIQQKLWSFTNQYRIKKWIRLIFRQNDSATPTHIFWRFIQPDGRRIFFKWAIRQILQIISSRKNYKVFDPHSQNLFIKQGKVTR